MANTKISISKNGTVTLATKGKYCANNIDVNVAVNNGKPAEEIEITANGTYAPEDVVYDKVIVNVPSHESKLDELTATRNGEYTPATGYDGFSKVKVDVPTEGKEPNLQNIELTKNGTYGASTGYDGFGTVKVNVSGGTFTATKNGTYVENDLYSTIIVDVPTGAEAPTLHDVGIENTGTHTIQLVYTTYADGEIKTVATAFNGSISIKAVEGSEIYLSFPEGTLSIDGFTGCIESNEYKESEGYYSFPVTSEDDSGTIGVMSTSNGSAPNLQELEVTANGEYTPYMGYDGFSKVDVSVSGETLNVTANGTYDDGLYDKVVVNVPTGVEAPTLHDVSISDDGYEIIQVIYTTYQNGEIQTIATAFSGSIDISVVEGSKIHLFVNNGTLSVNGYTGAIMNVEHDDYYGYYSFDVNTSDESSSIGVASAANGSGGTELAKTELQIYNQTGEMLTVEYTQIMGDYTSTTTDECFEDFSRTSCLCGSLVFIRGSNMGTIQNFYGDGEIVHQSGDLIILKLSDSPSEGYYNVVIPSAGESGGSGDSVAVIITSSSYDPGHSFKYTAPDGAKSGWVNSDDPEGKTIYCVKNSVLLITGTNVSLDGITNASDRYQLANNEGYAVIISEDTEGEGISIGVS